MRKAAELRRAPAAKLLRAKIDWHAEPVVALSPINATPANVTRFTKKHAKRTAPRFFVIVSRRGD